jgi:asparagine synthetase B (glutamine-hydrolysing)
MCGIFCSVARQKFVAPSPHLRKLLEARGPDASNLVETALQSSHDAPTSAWLTFYSTVLSLRGENVVTQPYASHAAGPVLCWNGEAWNIEHVAVKDSDTLEIYSRLGQALEACQSTDASSRLKNVALAMAKIAGPFAFIYYDNCNDCVYFGRDFLGRRSLLYQITPEGSILLCSVSDREPTSGWNEVEADGLYCINLRSVSQLEDCHSVGQVCWGGFRVLNQAYIRKEHDDVVCSSVGWSVKTGT